MNTSIKTEARAFTIKRDGERDISFSGWVLGTSSMKTGTGRGTDVGIFRTEGGRYVVAVHQWTAWDGERDLYRAGVCDGPEKLLQWVIDDCNDVLGPASKEAMEAASLTDEGIEAILCERIG